MSDQLRGVKHNYIRYANCWEDADVLIKALEIQKGDQVLSIGSAGDNSFSLLAQNPDLVVAVDVNIAQLELIHLKKVAIETLGYGAFMQLMGFDVCEHRWDLFKKIKGNLSSSQVLYWTERKKLIEEGIIYQGKFEKYFKLFRQYILPFIHSKSKVSKLFEKKDSAQQIQFYQKNWNSWKWRMLFKLFFSRLVMGRMGRDPAFFKEVEVAVPTFILEKVKYHLSTVECQQNHFLQFILTGKYGTAMPHYVKEENFNLIKSRLNKLVIYKGLVEDTFVNYQGFNKFNLSNIFEYMNPNLFNKVSKTLVEQGERGARYAYWNLMVPRRMSANNLALKYEEDCTKELMQKDKGFFYDNFIVDVKV